MVVAGHDLKFFTPLLDYLRLQPDLEVRLDQWAALGKHDEDVSRELAGWADVVICEWCGPNAVWYSKHKRRGSRLLVRLHRFELTSPYPAQVKIGAVSQVICVSPHYARLTRPGIFSRPGVRGMSPAPGASVLKMGSSCCTASSGPPIIMQ